MSEEEPRRKTDEPEHDVVVVGAGIAGTTASILFSRLGLDVLLIDRKESRDGYRVNCTTFIQPSALPVIRKLGIENDLDALGAIRNSALIWTKYGWIRDALGRDERYRHGYSLQRRKLDPMLLRKADENETVTVRLGASLHALVADPSGRIRGIRYRLRDGSVHARRARLVVLADGRDSRGARLAAVPTVRRENNRFVYFAYYRDMPLETGKTAQFWQKDRDMGFAYPFDDDLTMLCCFVTRDQYAAWRGDRFAALEAFFEDLPGAPDQRFARRASRVFGMHRLEDYKRPAVHRGLALIGDASMCCDPMAGVGCGFAMQSADWLVESVGEALAGGGRLAPGLARYKRLHRTNLSGHEYFIQDNSSGRAMNPLERLVARAAAVDAKVAHQLHLFIGRIVSWKALLAPVMLLRIVYFSVTYSRLRKLAGDHEPA